MKHPLILATVPLLALGLTACADRGYGTRVQMGWYDPYPYNGWYDGYYGPIYDGYWGNDGFFYYRTTSGDHHFRRGDHDHFRHEAVAGTHYQAIQGTVQPQRGYHMPAYPHRSRH